MYYHVLRSDYKNKSGLAIYTSDTDNPWKEEMNLFQPFTGSSVPWVKRWSLLHIDDIDTQEQTFNKYCRGSFNTFEEAYNCVVLESL